MLPIALACCLLLQEPPTSTPVVEPAVPTAPTAQDPPAPAPVVPENPPTNSIPPATEPPATPPVETTANPASTEPAGTTPAPAPTPATPGTVPGTATDAAADAAKAAADGMPPITEQDLADVLELAGMNAVSSLEREVKSLQQTLDGLVLADDQSVVKIHGAKGAEDDLESFGVDDAVARQVRRLLDEVKSKRAKLALLDLRGASSNNPNDGLRPVEELAATAAKGTAEPAHKPDDAAAKSPATALATALAAAPEDVLTGPSPDPQREALIAYRDRDVRTVLELLADTPMLRMKPLTLWAYGSCLMSERRYADAKAAFTRLKDEREHPQLAHGAQQQLERITFIENALVGEGPSTETKK